MSDCDNPNCDATDVNYHHPLDGSPVCYDCHPHHNSDTEPVEDIHSRINQEGDR